jgi:hypothetical protein
LLNLPAANAEQSLPEVWDLGEAAAVPRPVCRSKSEVLQRFNLRELACEKASCVANHMVWEVKEEEKRLRQSIADAVDQMKQLT